ncbi:hypothetical protein TTHERM_00094020 (macronuclear) [Tetrahymena thermophila SB210]|uniref:Uncharacterized protein n=1 Tax=Tetrahymena thermophila (strain SB210) TaxID=312017 RepID=Q235Y9_TETTS|nr:hypothetical protein TTHERM_00094020 [Tetrahymena thermophila SB210]EAR92611.2 hypothetical protein TTHERM_00094020 [Tetrahymena thermophila SB210]|eukprot:XP_001012856.2 hypothetical protein TTHERM_00094020 [Tetrahymena thermophila SB210]
MNNNFVSLKDDEGERQMHQHHSQDKFISYQTKRIFNIDKKQNFESTTLKPGENNIQKNTCNNLQNFKYEPLSNGSQQHIISQLSDMKDLRNIRTRQSLFQDQKSPQSFAFFKCDNSDLQNDKNQDTQIFYQNELNNPLLLQANLNENENEFLGNCDIQQIQNMTQNENLYNSFNPVFDYNMNANFDTDNINSYNFNNSSIFNQEKTYYIQNLNNQFALKEGQYNIKDYQENIKCGEYGQMPEQIYEKQCEINQQTQINRNENTSYKSQENQYQNIEDKKISNKSSIERLREYRQIKKRQKQEYLISRLQSLPKRVLRSSKQENTKLGEGENEVFQEQIDIQDKSQTQNEERESLKFQEFVLSKENNYYENNQKVNSFNNETMISTSYQFQNEIDDNDLNEQFFQPQTSQFYQDEVLSLSNQYSFELKNTAFQSSTNQTATNEQLQQGANNYYYNTSSLNEYSKNQRSQNRTSNHSVDPAHQNGSEKKNIVRNIMASFKRFIESLFDENSSKNQKSYQYQKTKFDIFLNQQEIFSFEETKKKVLTNLMELYNLKEKEKKINDQREFFNTFKKYYDKKQFNNTTLHQLLGHSNFGPVFVYFLRSFFANWLEKNLIMNSQTHLQMRDQIIQLHEEAE